jgi:Family of unknown function (DUF5302)
LAGIGDIDNQRFRAFLIQIPGKVSKLSNDLSNTPKKKYLEALEKKRSANAPKNQGKSGDSKVKGGQAGAGAPKMFRRKSGPS